jgi:hypothetical protein
VYTCRYRHRIMDCCINTWNLSNKRISNNDRLHAYENQKIITGNRNNMCYILPEANASELLLDTNMDQKPESETTWSDIWSGSKCAEFKEKHLASKFHL